MRRLLAVFLLAAAQLNWQTIDYSKQRITSADVAPRTLDELRLMRGIVFGRHGRIFAADRDIDRYLRAQRWYKPNREFTNDDLNNIERLNLDVIREAEAKRHPHVEPGDMRWWQKRAMTDELLGVHSGQELRVLLAEIEAIHGRTFPDSPTLRGYFEARYWYTSNDHYNPKMLTATERANMGVIEAAMRRQRGVVVLPGELGPYMEKPITSEMLNGLGLYELRLLRNEIYARRGRIFKADWLSGWFQQYDWYTPNENFRDEQLTPLQKNNAAVIAASERKLHEALSTTPIDPQTLEGLYAEDLKLLRNEIYARHGRAFKEPGISGYFSSLPWYKISATFTEKSLTGVERANVETIRRLETAAGSKISFEG